MIEEGVQRISERCFDECTALEEIVIADSVTMIEKFAFFHCTALEEITIPANVVELYSFAPCTSLTQINIDENNSVYSDIEINATIHCSDGVINGSKISYDINQDGNVDSSDALAILNMVVTDLVIQSADLNGDSFVDNK